MLAHETGILSATTAFGKTVVAASIIASRKTNTLVLVHRRELMDQWRERLGAFLNMDKKNIGIIGGGNPILKGWASTDRSHAMWSNSYVYRC
jgi:superfamily II DNA or RNA helicase